MVVSILVQRYASSDRDINVGKKKFRAISLLTSVASDFDLIADWWFFAAVKNEDSVPLILKQLQLGFCLVGLFTWLTLASDGRLIKPLLKLFNIRGFGTGHYLIIAVILEDIPQIILTALIEVRLDSGTFTYAVINFMTAIYDILIKVAEAYDERHDVHDTSGWQLKTFVGHQRIVTSVTNIDDKIFASGSADKTIKLWNIKKENSFRTLTGHKHRVSCIATFDENTIISGSWDRTIKIWNMTIGECISTLVGHNDAVTSVVKVNENIIASGSFDNTTKIWNLESGTCIRTLIGHEYRVNSIAKIDRNKIVTGSSDVTAKLWNISSGACIQTYEGHSQSVLSVASCNKDIILSCSGDLTAKMWNIGKGNCIRTFFGHTKPVSLVMDFDDNSFLTTSADKTMKLWEKETAYCLRTFPIHHNCSCIAKRSDQTVLTGLTDTYVKQWSITTISDKKYEEVDLDSIDVENVDEKVLTKSNSINIRSSQLRLTTQVDRYHRQSRPNQTTMVEIDSSRSDLMKKSEPAGESSHTLKTQDFWDQLDVPCDDSIVTDFEYGKKNEEKSMYNIVDQMCSFSSLKYVE